MLGIGLYHLPRSSTSERANHRTNNLTNWTRILNFHINEKETNGAHLRSGNIITQNPIILRRRQPQEQRLSLVQPILLSSKLRAKIDPSAIIQRLRQRQIQPLARKESEKGEWWSRPSFDFTEDRSGKRVYPCDAQGDLWRVPEGKVHICAQYGRQRESAASSYLGIQISLPIQCRLWFWRTHPFLVLQRWRRKGVVNGEAFNKDPAKILQLLDHLSIGGHSLQQRQRNSV